MAIVHRCLGCNKWISQENMSPILTPKTRRKIGEYVHTTQYGNAGTIIPSCHLEAFKKLKEDFPEIVIEGRILNEETTSQKPAQRKSGPSTSSEKYAGTRSGTPLIVCHVHA